MNILFLTLSKIYNIDEHDIYQDLIRELIARGHSVYVVTPIERQYGAKTEIIDFDGCQILRVKVGNQSNCSFIEKGISTITIGSQYKKAINSYFHNIIFDLILYSTPPITLVSLIYSIKRKNKSVTYLMLKDIFPQNAVDMGLMSKQGIIYKYFRRLEKKLYSVSDYIGCMSPENVKYLLSNNKIDEDKVEVCPNAITPQAIVKEVGQKNEEIRNKYAIPQDACVFIYGGNLGKPQGIDFVIECFRKIKKDVRYFVMVVGDGSEYENIQRFIDTEKPSNICLIKKLPRNEYFDILKCADVGMIFLDYSFTIPNFPSRILPYMEHSIPVLCVTDTVTDVGRIAEENHFGWYCPSNSTDCFEKILEEIVLADKTIIGKNAREFLEKNYTTDICSKKILSKIK